MKVKLIISFTVVLFLAGISTAAPSPNDVLKLWRQNYGKIDSTPLEISCTDRLIEVSSTKDPNIAKRYPYLVGCHRIQKDGKFFTTEIMQKSPSKEPVTLSNGPPLNLEWGAIPNTMPLNNLG